MQALKPVKNVLPPEYFLAEPMEPPVYVLHGRRFGMKQKIHVVPVQIKHLIGITTNALPVQVFIQIDLFLYLIKP